MNIKIDINVCRVCLQTGSGTSFYGELDYAKKFTFITQLQVRINKLHRVAAQLPSSTIIYAISLVLLYNFKMASKIFIGSSITTKTITLCLIMCLLLE